MNDVTYMYIISNYDTHVTYPSYNYSFSPELKM